MSIQDRIARGAALLDEKMPGWIDKQDLIFLNMASGCHCVLGQCGGEYHKIVTRLWQQSCDVMELEKLSCAHGFNIAFDESNGLSEKHVKDYQELTDAWKLLIAERRRAELTPVDAL